MLIIEAMRERSGRRANLPFENSGACLNGLYERRALDFNGAILRIGNDRVQINSLFGMGFGKNVSNINYHEDRMRRILRAVSLLLG